MEGTRSVLENLRLNHTPDLLQRIHELLSQRSRRDDPTARNPLHLLLIVQNNTSCLAQQQPRKRIHIPLEHQLPEGALWTRRALLVRRGDSAVLHTIIGPVFPARTGSRRVDEFLHQAPYERNKKQAQAGHEADMKNGSDEGIPHAEKLSKVKPGAVELGHQSTASMHDAHITESGRRGGECAQIADGADAQRLLEEGVGRDVLGWWGGGEREGVEGCEHVGYGEGVECG